MGVDSKAVDMFVMLEVSHTLVPPEKAGVSEIAASILTEPCYSHHEEQETKYYVPMQDVNSA